MIYVVQRLFYTAAELGLTQGVTLTTWRNAQFCDRFNRYKYCYEVVTALALFGKLR
jgi:hypothetical protein